MPPRTSEPRGRQPGRRGGALGCLLWLVLLAGGVYVGWHLGRPYVQAWRFEEAMKDQAAIADRVGDAEIRRNLEAVAARLEVPLDPAEIRIRRDAETIVIAAEWTQTVTLPRFTRTLAFEREVSATVINTNF